MSVVREQLMHLLSRAHGFSHLSNHSTTEAALEEIPNHHPDVLTGIQSIAVA